MLGIATVIAIMLVTGPCHATSPELRGASRDAANAAWLMSSLVSGSARGSVEIPSTNSQDSTFDQIQSLCRSHGVPTELRSLTYPELSVLGQPAVVLLRHGPETTGFFAVVVHAGPGQVTSINAGWMTVGVYSEDEFRLRWTGHALVPQRDNQISFVAAMTIVLAGLAIPYFGVLSYRRILPGKS